MEYCKGEPVFPKLPIIPTAIHCGYRDDEHSCCTAELVTGKTQNITVTRTPSYQHSNNISSSGEQLFLLCTKTVTMVRNSQHHKNSLK